MVPIFMGLFPRFSYILKTIEIKRKESFLYEAIVPVVWGTRLGYRSGGPGSIPGTTREKKK
jgi:hypothetical protein